MEAQQAPLERRDGKAVTYVMQTYRHDRVLDSLIDPDSGSICMQAMSFAETFCAAAECTDLDIMLQEWDPEEETFEWEDEAGEYRLTIGVYVAKSPAREDNSCKVIFIS